MLPVQEIIMAATTFDTLGYFEKLKAAGVPEVQAKAQVEVIRDVIEDKLATKQDIKELEYRLTIRFGSMTAAAVALLSALMALMR
jgi:hypothetical protein